MQYKRKMMVPDRLLQNWAKQDVYKKYMSQKAKQAKLQIKLNQLVFSVNCLPACDALRRFTPLTAHRSWNWPKPGAEWSMLVAMIQVLKPEFGLIRNWKQNQDSNNMGCEHFKLHFNFCTNACPLNDLIVCQCDKTFRKELQQFI